MEVNYFDFIKKDYPKTILVVVPTETFHPFDVDIVSVRHAFYSKNWSTTPAGYETPSGATELLNE